MGTNQINNCRLGRIGGVYPIGSSVGQVTVEGMQWDLWIGYNGAMKVFSFIAPQERRYYSGDVKRYFDYIRDRHGFPANNQYLLSMSRPTYCLVSQPTNYLQLINSEASPSLEAALPSLSTTSGPSRVKRVLMGESVCYSLSIYESIVKLMLQPPKLSSCT